MSLDVNSLVAVIPVFGGDHTRPASFFVVLPGDKPGVWVSSRVTRLGSPLHTARRHFGNPVSAVADAIQRANDGNRAALETGRDA